MKSFCALCGRQTMNPAVTIGDYPVGPKCAKRAGLLDLSRRKTGLVCHVVRYPKKPRPNEAQIELFKEDQHSV